MQTYRGIVRTYRQVYGLSTRPDNHNNLTHQSADMNDAPRDPLHVPVTCNTARTQPYYTLRLRICLRLRLRLRPRASLPLSQSPRALYRSVKRSHIVASGIQC